MPTYHPPAVRAMLSYRHRFHAGNHADVLKHVVLVALIDALTHKPKPLLYIDTHAGAGRYRLSLAATGGLAEYASGIDRLAAASDPPELIARYQRAAQPEAEHYYGSSLIAAACLRPIDRIAACELNRDDAEQLALAARGYSRFSVRQEDGYAALKALLPPQERRGLVLMDPSYERPDEAKAIAAALSVAVSRFPTGVYAVWYPLMGAREHERLLRELNAQHRSLPRLGIELSVHAIDHPLGLNGSGLWILNPPYGVDADLAGILPWLHATLAPGGSGSWRVQPEPG